MSKEEDRTWQDRCPYLLGLLEIKVPKCVQGLPYPYTYSSHHEASGQAALEDRNQRVRPRNHVMSQLKKDGGSGKPSMTTITSCGKSSSSKDVSYSSSLQRDKGGQPAASSKRQFRFSREPHEKWPLSGSVQIGRLDRESLYQVRSWNA